MAQSAFRMPPVLGPMVKARLRTPANQSNKVNDLQLLRSPWGRSTQPAGSRRRQVGMHGCHGDVTSLSVRKHLIDSRTFSASGTGHARVPQGPGQDLSSADEIGIAWVIAGDIETPFSRGCADRGQPRSCRTAGVRALSVPMLTGAASPDAVAPQVGTYVPVVVTRSFPNSLLGEMVI